MSRGSTRRWFAAGLVAIITLAVGASPSVATKEGPVYRLRSIPGKPIEEWPCDIECRCTSDPPCPSCESCE